MIEWSIDAFRACDSVDSIVVAVPPGFADGVAGSYPTGFSSPAGGDRAEIAVVDGGATRARSVANALEAVSTELVAIHDAARPLLTPELVEALVARLAAAPEAAGAIAASPVTDTVKQAAASSGSKTAFPVDTMGNAGLVVERTLDRSRLWGAQTPQVFRTAVVREALAVDEAVRVAATDEAMLVEATGGTVLIHDAGPQNFKVTTPLDLRVAELLLAERR